VQEVIYGLVGVSARCSGRRRPRDLFNLLTSALGIFTLLVTATVLAPAEPRARLAAPTPTGSGTAGQTGDRDSLGYFALRDDKSVIWSRRKAAVCYRVVSGVMLASGDPIGIRRPGPARSARSWTRRRGTPGARP